MANSLFGACTYTSKESIAISKITYNLTDTLIKFKKWNEHTDPTDDLISKEIGWTENLVWLKCLLLSEKWKIVERKAGY